MKTERERVQGTPTDLVTIELMEELDDVLQRVAVMNAALFRVLSGVQLIRVLEADYMAGRIRALVEAHRQKPRARGKVCITYEPLPEPGC